jgi:hypothetical protein
VDQTRSHTHKSAQSCQSSTYRTFLPPPLPRAASIIILVLLGLLHSLHLHTPRLPPLLIPRRKLVLAPVPQILKRQLLGTAQTLNIGNPVQGGFEELFKARLGTDLVEGALHGHAVGAHHGVAVDGEDAELVVAADEVGARHDEARAVQGEFGQDVAVLRGVGGVHFVVAVVEGVG